MLAEILGIEPGADEDGDTVFLVTNLGIHPGTYVRPDPYHALAWIPSPARTHIQTRTRRE
ncbi:hypothetical protein [Nocardiopsis sp. JB363]|uniref:hypothetical protein n=1 Tax=Nocardiopsis sp. JB363 TaxID=1434837 RepID=UPI00097A84D9|nr:hypothetical protein [Nocardiopsis sp. JB363]SIO87040.1 hypothetical protein BQ8420_14800 [Nocardiopsis sp. JB363]